MDQDQERWSDKELRELRTEFTQHMADERLEKQQQQELHEAIFRKGDKELGTPPGLLQLTTQISERLTTMEERERRRLSFAGGVAFAVSSLWFFVTDMGQKLVSVFHKLFG